MIRRRTGNYLFIFAFSQISWSWTRCSKNRIIKVHFQTNCHRRIYPSWSPDRFAQIDFILVPHAFQNGVLDISAGTDIAFDSDHCIVTANLRVKLKVQSKSPPSTVVRYHQPTEGQKQHYNDPICHRFNVVESQHIFGVNFVQAMKLPNEFYRVIRFKTVVSQRLLGI